MKSIKVSTRLEIMDRLFLAVDFMHSNYRYKVSVDEIAQSAMLSKFHFLRTFKEVFKMSPHQYLTQLRLAKAKDLLKTTKWSIQEVSTFLGYQEANSFIRLFSNRFSISPGKFRN